MNLNNFTIKSQEAVQQAQHIATTTGNQSIETGHLLKGLLETDENVISFLLKKLNKISLFCLLKGFLKT
jgi:ATP-dependent Clp protease ATP-binding subunit ClpB